MAPNKTATAFLAALDRGAEDPTPSAPASRPAAKATAKAATGSRVGLKHIGGYFDQEDVEKVALLRARLGLDNSQLLQRAIQELHARETARRAFGG